MAVSSQLSLVMSLLLTVSLFAGLQLSRHQLTASPVLTVSGGALGSLLFLLLLTAVGNLEASLFGTGFQTKLMEVIVCLLMACAAVGMVHRVCVTVCFILSMVVLYYMNRISQSTYGAPAVVQMAPTKKRK